jgi:DNA-directed RNA polymerase subunit beta'
MMDWVKVEDIGDMEFLPEEVMGKFKLPAENQRVMEAGGRPKGGECCWASLRRRLVQFGGVFPGDHARAHRSRHQRQGGLPRGLKENVIMVRLVPAGTVVLPAGENCR